MSPGCVCFTVAFAFVGIHAAFGDWVYRFFGAALGTTIGEAGFIGFQFELFGANGTDFDGKRHNLHDKTHFVGCIPLRRGLPMVGGRYLIER